MSQPKIKRLAKSASKSQLLDRLTPVGFTEGDYELMLREAERSRDWLSVDRNSLTALSASDPNISPPYTYDALTETARHRMKLYTNEIATSRTKHFYSFGHYKERSSMGENEENWIIEWFLWHSFRYRDNRDRSGSAASAVPTPPPPIPVLVSSHTLMLSVECIAEAEDESESGPAHGYAVD